MSKPTFADNASNCEATLHCNSGSAASYVKDSTYRSFGQLYDYDTSSSPLAVIQQANDSPLWWCKERWLHLLLYIQYSPIYPFRHKLKS